MDLEVLKKKISTFRGEGGRVRITDESLLLEILCAWEQWTGPGKDFYRSIGVSAKGMARMLGRAKKLRREGHFPVEEFKEIKIEGGAGAAAGGMSPCAGIELIWSEGRIIRFSEVEPLIDFLKKAA